MRDERDGVDMPGIEEGEGAPIAGEPEDLFEEERDEAAKRDRSGMDDDAYPGDGPARQVTG
jgi:hypothetical protein